MNLNHNKLNKMLQSNPKSLISVIYMYTPLHLITLKKK